MSTMLGSELGVLTQERDLEVTENNSPKISA